MSRIVSLAGALALSSLVSGCVSLGGVAEKMADDDDQNPPHKVVAKGLDVNKSGNNWVTSYVEPVSVQLNGLDEAAGTASASVTVGDATYTIAGNGGYYNTMDAYYQGFEIEDKGDSNRILDGAIGQHSIAGIFSLSSTHAVVAHGALDDTVVTTPPKQSVNYSGIWTVVSEAHMTDDHAAEGTFSGAANFDSGTWAFNLNGHGVNGGTTAPVSGTASGSIDGVNFNGSMNTTGGFNMSGGEVDGRFYGPNAEELAGTVHGNSDRGKAIGQIMGHQ